jgi:AraC family transcriptional regulator
MGLLAHVRIAMWQGGSLWVANALPKKTVPRTEPHAHHAIQVTLALDGTIRFLAGDLDIRGDAVAVAPDAVHVFEASGLMAHLFIEPESRAGRTISHALLEGAPLAAVPAGQLHDIAERITAVSGDAAQSNTSLIELGRGLIDRLAGSRSGDAPDRRVRQMIALATQKLDGPVSLADVAGTGGLSPSRLRHLFVKETGLQFRTYLLWLRLTRAVELAAAGAPLTQAAYEAGFADSAHFSRTFRRMFGLSPTSLHMS